MERSSPNLRASGGLPPCSQTKDLGQVALSNLERARRQLGDYYEESLQRRLTLLEEWCASFDAADDDQQLAIRRAAHQLHGSAASFGFPGLSDLGAAAEQAPIEELPSVLLELRDEIRRALVELRTQNHPEAEPEG